MAIKYERVVFMGIFSRGKKYELLAVVRDNDHVLGYSSDNFAYIRELVPRKGMDPKIYCMGFDGLGSYFLDNARTKLDMAIPKSASLLTVKANSHIISDKPFHSFGKPYGSLDASSYDIFERDMARDAIGILRQSMRLCKILIIAVIRCNVSLIFLTMVR